MARGMGGSSGFMKELANKLAFVRVELLSKYNLGDLGQEWYVVASFFKKYSTYHIYIVSYICPVLIQCM